MTDDTLATLPELPREALIPCDPTAFAGQVWAVRCPACGEDCIEQGGLPEVPREQWAVSVHEDLDDYEARNPLSTRGGYTEVRLWCSACSERFRLVTANHKGAQFLGLARGW